MRFTGRIALVSAAGRGIGRESAEIIGREGGTVIAVDNDKDALESVVARSAPAAARPTACRPTGSRPPRWKTWCAG